MKSRQGIYSLWPQWEEEQRGSVTASPAGVLAWRFGLNRRQEKWWLSRPGPCMVLTKLPSCLGTWLLTCPTGGQHFVKSLLERQVLPRWAPDLKSSSFQVWVSQGNPKSLGEFPVTGSVVWWLKKEAQASLRVPLLLQGWRHLPCHPASRLLLWCSDSLNVQLSAPELPLASLWFVIHRLCLTFPPELLPFISTKKVKPRSFIVANL